MDKPTSALDLSRQMEVLRLMRAVAESAARQCWLLLHEINDALRFADRTMVIADGRLVAYGPPREVTTSALLREVYKLDARIRCVPAASVTLSVDGEVDKAAASPAPIAA